MEQKVFTIEVEEAGDYIFTVTQKGKANMSAQDSEKYRYSDVRVFVVEVPKDLIQDENNKTKLNKGCIFIDGYLKAEKRDIYVSANLPKAGQYALIAEVDWDIQTSEKVFSLTSYGPQELKFVENFDISISEVLRSACDSIFRKYDHKKIPKNITDKNGVDMEVTRTHISADFGYDFYEYRNDMQKLDVDIAQDKEMKYFETLTFPKD